MGDKTINCHFLMQTEHDRGCLVIKGRKAWRLPMATLSPVQYAVAFQEPLYFGEGFVKFRGQIEHIVYDRSPNLLPNSQLVKLCNVTEVRGLRFMTFDELLIRRLELPSRVLISALASINVSPPLYRKPQFSASARVEQE